MSITGLPGQGPVRVGIPIADLTAGNLLALGIMMALFERERTGVGRWVTTWLLEAQVFMLDFQASRWLMAGEVARQAGNDHPTGIPMGVFPTSRRADQHRRQLGAAVGAVLRGDRAGMDWLKRPEWQSQKGRSADRKRDQCGDRRDHPHQAGRALDRAVRGGRHPVRPDQHDRPGVRRSAGAASRHRGTRCITRASAIRTWWPRRSTSRGVPKTMRMPTPDVGAHTDEVLAWVGYTRAEIAEMRAKGA